MYYFINNEKIVKGDLENISIYDSNGENEEMKLNAKSYSNIIEISKNLFKVLNPISNYSLVSSNSYSNNNNNS